MKRASVLAAFVLFSLYLLWNAPEAHALPYDTDPGSTNAESLRRFLAKQGRLSPSLNLHLAKPLSDLYAIPSIEKPQGCPLSTFRDQPPVALRNAINIYIVDLETEVDDQVFAGLEGACKGAPDPATCQAIADGCISLGTSVFCDRSYMARRISLAQSAYFTSSKSATNIVRFLPLNRHALLELAHQTQAGGAGYHYRGGTPTLAEARRFAERADSSVYEFALQVSLIAPILHETAHIEQTYCGRGIATEGRDDFVGRVFLTGERNLEAKAELYELLTCSSLSRLEVDADLRSMDMLLRFLEKGAPRAIQNSWFQFAEDVNRQQRARVESLARWTREIAMLSILYGLEYDLLVHGQPELALAWLEGEPTGSLQSYMSYYIKAGQNSSIPRVRGHLEPAFRLVELAKALNAGRLIHLNKGKSGATTHVRVAPFAIGRFLAMRRACGAGPIDTAWKEVADYVLEAFQEPLASPTQRDELREARELLTSFMTPGIDRAALTRRLRPSRMDYSTVFEQPFADRAYKFYESWWNSGEMEIAPQPGQTELLVYAVRSDDLREGSGRHLQRGYEEVADVIKPGLTIYRWRYVKPGRRFGMAYDGLYYVNDHWVWIPKPYRVPN